MIFLILDEYVVVAFYRHSLAHDEFTVDHGLNVSTKNIWNDNFHEIILTISNTFSNVVPQIYGIHQNIFRKCPAL